MAVPPIPRGYHAVVPYLVAADAAALVEFLERAFDAEIHHTVAGPDGKVGHADVIIGGSHIMMGQAHDKWPAMQGSICVYVPNCDQVYATALEAGAESVMPPADMFYGDRQGGVRDPQGNMWWIATHIEDVAEDELQRRAAAQHGK